MQIKTFTIPIHDDGGWTDELNRFLRSRMVLEVEREFVQAGSASCWCFCVRYLDGSRDYKGSAKRKRIDYKEVLDETTFAKFAALRTRRKEIADAEGIPAFAVFTDAHLAEMAQLRDLTPTTMAKVTGIGVGKVERYGERLLAVLNTNETDAMDAMDGPDSDCGGDVSAPASVSSV